MGQHPHSARERPEGERTKERGENRAPELLPYSDPYATLGVPRAATMEQIKDAYFAKVREHPPERDPETFKAIRAAYDRLRTAERRLETDMLLLQELDLSTDLPAPTFDLTAHREDLLSIARAFSDVERMDFREHFRKIDIPK